MKFKKIVVFLLILTMSLAFTSTQHIVNSTHSDEISKEKVYSTSYTPHDPIWIQSNQEFEDQATAESWAGDGSEETPYIITGYSFNQETQPLRIWDTDVHWRFINNRVDGLGDDIQCGTWIEDASNGAIINCEFLNRHSGMVIVNAANMTISGNYIHDMSLRGIEITGMTTNCEITENTVENCVHHGILVGGMTSGTLSENVVTNCGGRGIFVNSGFHNSEIKQNVITNIDGNGIYVGMATSSEISFNTISNADGCGIEIIGSNMCTIKNNSIDTVSEEGISVDYCELSDISMNEIYNCTGIGLELLGTSNNTIHKNTISECDDYAISLNSDTEFFDIKYNVFINNGIDCQLYDDGDDNVFCYNYFSDWLTPDTNSDGFVDLAYEVDGTSENTDDWPITQIGIFPTVPTLTNTTGTTTPVTDTPLDLTMILVIVGGIGSIIVIITGILVMKRR
ncbi:right-handed parallel beta-helix repeat-containing protein [Candidatus Thorarchaeota archaeon]|nr:MAG: right-handed parallel beta-helix repeat-containing protein [Candidatus Thorarchaeota archaeon]